MLVLLIPTCGGGTSPEIVKQFTGLRSFSAEPTHALWYDRIQQFLCGQIRPCASARHDRTLQSQVVSDACGFRAQPWGGAATYKQQRSGHNIWHGPEFRPSTRREQQHQNHCDQCHGRARQLVEHVRSIEHPETVVGRTTSEDDAPGEPVFVRRNQLRPSRALALAPRIPVRNGVHLAQGQSAGSEVAFWRGQAVIRLSTPIAGRKPRGTYCQCMQLNWLGNWYILSVALLTWFR